MRYVGLLAFCEPGNDHQGVDHTPAGIAPTMTEFRREEKAVAWLQVEEIFLHIIIQMPSQAVYKLMPRVHNIMRAAGCAALQSEHERFDPAGKLLPTERFEHSARKSHAAALIVL